MNELLADMDRYIVQKGLGNLLTTAEGIEFLRNYLTLKGLL